MKRSQMYKKINRKKSIFNHVNRNVVYPTIFFNTSLDEEEKNNAVEIVELNSDEAVPENEQQIFYNNNHAWCNTTDSFQEHQDDYTVNTRARDKRRQNKAKENINTNSKYDDDVLNQFCSEFYGIDCHDRGERISTKNNPHSDFFTIINNHLASDTSSDSNVYDDIEIVKCENTLQDDYWNGNVAYEDNNDTYSIDCNTEKRTIWIYALKNKRYLSENDFELINIPSKESTSTTEEEEPSTDIPKIRRIATPIPSYIPRLNLPLSPILPTVTEVTESNKQITSNSEISPKDTMETAVFQKPLNSWLGSEINETQNDKIIINKENNFQALSPRERRRLKLTKTNEPNKVSKQKIEARVYLEPTVIIQTNNRSPEFKTESSEKEISNIDTNESCGQVKSINNTKNQRSVDNGLDYDEVGKLQKPRMNLNANKNACKSYITDPIEKPDGNWIGNNDEVLEVYDYDIKKTNDNVKAQVAQTSPEASNNCAGDKLFIRNISLMKPAEWTQYLPVTGSVPSLHLSISLDTDFDDEKRSWFKRFLKFVHCCK